MAPPGFKTLSLPNFCVEEIQRLRRLLANKGIGSLPPDLVPEEYRNATSISNGMALELAFRALERFMNEHPPDLPTGPISFSKPRNRKHKKKEVAT